MLQNAEKFPEICHSVNRVHINYHYPRYLLAELRGSRYYSIFEIKFSETCVRIFPYILTPIDVIAQGWPEP